MQLPGTAEHVTDHATQGGCNGCGALLNHRGCAVHGLAWSMPRFLVASSMHLHAPPCLLHASMPYLLRLSPPLATSMAACLLVFKTFVSSCFAFSFASVFSAPGHCFGHASPTATTATATTTTTSTPS